MLKLGVYIRVSTDRLEQRSSLENQKELFIQYAQQNNYLIHDFYVDIESGTKVNRPGLQRLIEDTKTNKFDIIVSKELSRLARNGELSYRLKRIAESNAVDLITLDGAINTIEGSWELFGLYAWIYEKEAANTSDRLKKALTTRAENGLFTGSIPPYGYYCKKGKFIIRDDNTPNIIRRIFTEYISGKGIDSIARDLFLDKIPTPSQVAKKKNASDIWYGKTIKKILTNQAYIGNMEQKKESTLSVVNKKRVLNDNSKRILIENTHDPIIPKEMFLLVQQLLKSRHKERGHQTIHLFTNVLRCADCGKGMHFKKNIKGYVCGTSVKLGKNICSDHIIREADLYEVILKDLNTHFSLNPQISIPNPINDEYKKIVKQYKGAINSTEQKLEKLQKRKTNSINFLLDGTLNKHEYNKFLADYTIDVKRLSNELSAYKSSLHKLTSPSTIEKIATFKAPTAKIVELTPEILNMSIEKIEISECGSPKIYYRFSQ